MLFDTYGISLGGAPRIVLADHAEGEGGRPPPAEGAILVYEDRPAFSRRSEFCYRCLDPLRKSVARPQPCRPLWVGKGTYIAEFHFCEANCAPYIERIFPSVEWKERVRAV